MMASGGSGRGTKVPGGVLCAACVVASCAGRPAPLAAGPCPPVSSASPAASASVATAAATASAAPSPARPAGSPALTDEGMWLLNDFPAARVQALHGFAPGKEWLEHVQRSALRFAGGCSGSFVSAQGLVMTNHHCASSCIEQLSTSGKDLVARGFLAKTGQAERRCADMELDQLVEITDVTARVTAATGGLSGARFGEAQRAELSRIEKECATSDELRCDVVSLYHGGRYHLYRYLRHEDVRLVFAPEFQAAFFGGDPDNFMFPRFDLDVSFLRVYSGGKPLETKEHLEWSPAGVKEGDLTFVAGHPWGTSRELTVAELEFQRDVALPARLLQLAEARGLLTEFRERGAEQKRISGALLFGIENSLKARSGRVAALRDPEVFGAKVRAEAELRARIAADPGLARATSGAWDAIAAAEQRLRQIRVEYELLEQGTGFWSELFEHARRLVRAAEERPRPSEQRLREFGDARLPALRQRVLSTAPIHAELEILKLTQSLTTLRAELGPDHALVRQVLGTASPRDVATRLVKGTKLAAVAARTPLFDGGQGAVLASKDPMIALARLVDPAARAVRKIYEDEVEAVVKKNGELLAAARFQVYGTNVYPDATGTLRLSYGTVRGWEENGKPVPPITTFQGAFDRATGAEPFALPASWLSHRKDLDLGTPLNFCTTNDIIGGNSGSPVIDRDARVVGLIFDGNIHSLGGDFVYDPVKNRAVAVHSAALVQALSRIYGASRVTEELLPAR